MSRCDKCHMDVPFDNDATFIESIVTGQPFTILANKARHFLPTENCEGSPSRAQYIEGQPRDKRGYPYNPEMEQVWRDAYAKNLEDCKFWETSKKLAEEEELDG